MARRLRVLAAGVVAVAMAGCWYQPGQGPNRSSYNPSETEIGAGNVADLTEQWTADTDGTVVGSPVVSNVGVHVRDNAESFYGLDIATGERRWTHHLENPGIPLQLGTTFTDGNRVLVSSGIGNLGGHYSAYWLDAATGVNLGDGNGFGLPDALRGTRSAWRHVGFGSGTPVATSLRVADSADPGAGWAAPIFVNSGIGGPAAPPVTLGTNGVYQAGLGFNDQGGPSPTTGNGIRSWPLDDPTMCPPPANVLACPTWNTPIAGTGATVPVLGDDENVLYTVNDQGTVFAVGTSTGSIQWTATLGSASTGVPALAEGVLYVPTAAGLFALDADGCGGASCGPLWRGTDAGATGGADEQPAVANGVVYAAWGDGSVRAFDTGGCGAATCGSLWSSLIGSPVTGAPAVTGGQLYVGTQDGRVVAYGLD